MLHSVIMAGGSGTRFWPLSRQMFPKQFLTLQGNRSLIQQAFDRCQPWIPPERCWVVTAERLAELTRKDLPLISDARILQEPAARNTAPCIGLAALCLEAIDPEATMLVIPADQVISDLSAFESDVRQAVKLVTDDPERLVLFGVPPSYPATGFGYIERGNPLGSAGYEVASFREKPDRTTAESYLQAGTFYWNCGIFVWKARRILQALARHEPAISAGLKALRPHLGQPTFQTALAEIFPTMTSVSIDYAVLEREKNIAVLAASFPWDDVGGWEALTRLLPPDANGNVVLGQAACVDSQDCIVRTTDTHVVTLLGVKNCIVVQTPDATLVAQRGDDEAIRKVIAALKEQGFEHYL
jgi:mannose-1-phosphate guanylyltransferase